MPELVSPKNIELGPQVASSQEVYWSSKELKKFLSTKGVEFVGRGTFNTLFSQENADKEIHKDVIVALHTKENALPAEMRKRYYVHKLMHVLFPHNFPQFLTTFSTKTKDGIPVSGTVRQRIEPRMIQMKMFLKYPFAQVEEARLAMRLPIEFDLSHNKNLLIGKDGGEYSAEDIQTAKQCLKRLNFYSWVV